MKIGEKQRTMLAQTQYSVLSATLRVCVFDVKLPNFALVILPGKSTLFTRMSTGLDSYNHYEIITLKIFVILKRHGNHTEKYLQRKPQGLSRTITLKYFPLLFKDTEITLKIFQRYSFLLFPGFSALL